MPPERTRRSVLAAAGAVLAGGAGCAATPPQTEPTADGSGTPSGEGTDPETTQPADAPPRSSGPAPDHQDVYREAIGSVGLIRVFGPMSESQGSGFVYDRNHLVTNEHVVAAGEEFQVEFREGEWSEAELVGTDAFSDLAVLELLDRPEYATPLEFVEAEPPNGAPVLALGAPFGLSQTATAGIVSARNRSLPAESGFRVPDSIQTDAAVNPGNSGGPLLDMDSDVVGVVSAGGGDNVGFAVSAAVCKRILPALIADGEFAHPFIGVQLSDVTPAIARANDLDRAQGAMVTGVIDGEPADGVLRGADDSATVRDTEVPVGGDIIVEIDGQPTRSVARISQYLILEGSPGDDVSITVLRDGSRTTVELTLGRRREDR